jgi:hypothetical protein
MGKIAPTAFQEKAGGNPSVNWHHGWGLLEIGIGLLLLSMGPMGCKPFCNSEVDTRWIESSAKNYPAVPGECFTGDDPVATTLGNTSAIIPRPYLEPVSQYFEFMTNHVSPEHHSSGTTENLIFYDTEREGCVMDDVYSRVSGHASNGNQILLNDRTFKRHIMGTGKHRFSFFAFLLMGPKHILSHEYGHILLNPQFVNTPNEELAFLTPQNICDRKHYLVDRFGSFVEMAYVIHHEEQFYNEHLMVENLIPLLVEHPELKNRIIDLVDGLSLNALFAHKKYHDDQLSFFTQMGVIRDYEPLQFANVEGVFTRILQFQKENAYAALDMF